MTGTNGDRFDWWGSLRHGGLLLDTPRLNQLLSDDQPAPLSSYDQDRLRRRVVAFQDAPKDKRSDLIAFVMEAICGFQRPLGEWYRGPEVSTEWSRRMITGESVRPRHIWKGQHGALLPVFISDDKRIGIGKGKRVVSHALQWLRQSPHRLALVTNGTQWRLLFAGLDYEAFCEWDVGQWFTEGVPSAELNGFRALFCPPLWTPPAEDELCPLLAAINESRKGQAELSQVLGERVRQAVELLIQGHATALQEKREALNPQDIYRAAVRMVMRMVVVLFAESREGLLPRDNRVYHDGYSLQGLRDQLQRASAHRLSTSYGAYPRIMALFRLINQGCSHEALAVPNYGGQLFGPGDADSEDGMLRALAVFERGCFEYDVMRDARVHAILDLLTRTRIKIRQGRSSTWMPAPVDFSSLDSEYIGILYEGLLDFELRQAADGDPIIFLAVGNQPALPLSTLEEMDDRALKNLLDKMKDTSTADEEEESEEEIEEGEEATDSAEEEDEAEEDEEDETEVEEEDDDARHTTRTRAEAWAHRAIEVGRLVNRPRGTMTEEKRLQYQASVDRKARQIVTRVVLPGEWYLVRWGGTRKGSGTFYTRPQLAVPTVHRTLRPLAYDPPTRDNGDPNEDAPVEAWTPKPPEEILSLKVCDPACGSGTFPLAALRFLTEALFASLHHYDRISYFSDRTVIDLIVDSDSGQPLSGEALPCRPEDADFEPRTKAVLRRYVVERCIYGVDVDPLAVELCRLSLWIETLDPRLPFTFLDHKIKCGNSLIGTWFDQFMHYPAMAWMREGGDKNHTNGVHFERESWTKAIKEKVKDVKKELKDYIDGAKLIYRVDLSTIQTVHDVAEQALQDIHRLGIHEVDQRAKRYRELRESTDFRDMKAAFDLWCSLWFWPPEQIDVCPLPLDFYENELTDEARQIFTHSATERHFFHWELEFPDAFNQKTLGFDAILGNPPWDIAKPNSKEFFSALDPLYRSYGKQEAITKQKEQFAFRRETEQKWLTYNAYFRAQSNWVKYAGHPFGDRITTDSNNKQSHDVNLGDRGRSSFSTGEARHEKWRQKREELTGYADAEHSFRHQGSGDINLYKMFLEQAHVILREHGRLGLIVPAGIYSDHGTGKLRKLFLERCQWQWLFGFENREGIFDIHRSFKFNPIIIQKGGQTEIVKTSFMRRSLTDWEAAESLATELSRSRILTFSPNSRVILEVESEESINVLSNVYSNGVLLGQDPGWDISYIREFDMTNDSKLFRPRDFWEEEGYIPDEYSRWVKGNWRSRSQESPAPASLDRASIPPGILLSRDGDLYLHVDEIESEEFVGKKREKLTGPAIALPVFEGRMIGQFDFSEKGWVSGKGRTAVWKNILWESKIIEPQYLMALPVFGAYGDLADKMDSRVAFMDVTSATNERTMIAALVPFAPLGNSAPALGTAAKESLLVAVLNSLVFDYVCRARCSGLHLNWFVIEETVLPRLSLMERTPLAALTTQLAGPSPIQATVWERNEKAWRAQWALTLHERVRIRCMIEAIVAACFSLEPTDYRAIVRECDYPVEALRTSASQLSPKGFWRIDKSRHPELRLTILSLLCLEDLFQSIRHAGDLVGGIDAFCSRNGGEGWMLPDAVRLRQFGLGHDARAELDQPVADEMGPRFYDWQRSEIIEASWREQAMHIENLSSRQERTSERQSHEKPVRSHTPVLFEK